MVDKSRKIAKKLAAKLRSIKTGRVDFVTNTLHDIKKNWVEIKSITHKISPLEPKSMGL